MAKAPSEFIGLDLRDIKKVELKFCAPATRAHLHNDKAHTPIAKCGLVLGALYKYITEETRYSRKDLPKNVLAQRLDTPDAPYISKLFQGEVNIQGTTSHWNECHELMRYMLLGPEPRVLPQPENAASLEIADRILEQLFGDKDTDGVPAFFHPSSLKSGFPTRPRDAHYQMLWLAHHVASSGTRARVCFVSAHEPFSLYDLNANSMTDLGDSAIAACMMGIDVSLIYPAVDSGASKSAELFRLDHNHAIISSQLPRFTKQFVDVNPKFSLSKEAKSCLKLLPIKSPLPVCFINPIFKYVYLEFTMDKKKREHLLMFRPYAKSKDTLVAEEDELKHFQSWLNQVNKTAAPV